jgi:hypothetical protein
VHTDETEAQMMKLTELYVRFVVILIFAYLAGGVGTIRNGLWW